MRAVNVVLRAGSGCMPGSVAETDSSSQRSSHQRVESGRTPASTSCFGTSSQPAAGPSSEATAEAATVRAMRAGELIALARLEGAELLPVRVFSPPAMPNGMRP